MTSRWASVLVPLFGGVGVLQAQGVQGRELGAHATATASDPAVAVAGLYAAVRASSRARLTVAAGVGTSDGQAAWRGELLGHFLLSPGKRRGPGFYVGGGVAAVAGPIERGYLVLTAGAEGAPGSRSGWALEIGVGGGARLAIGYRWRWLSVPGGD